MDRTSSEKAHLLADAASYAREFIETERAGRVAPDPEELLVLKLLSQPSPDEPIPAANALQILHQVGQAAAVRSTGGRYFGFVNGGVTPVALGASVLANTWDQNLAVPAMSPVASEIDRIAAAWMIDVLELPGTATAAFCAGATIANITGIVTGRDALLRNVGWDIGSQGLFGAPLITVVISAEAHVTMHKALRVAGIGAAQIHEVAADEWGRLDPLELPPITGPTLMLLQAGNVNTGHSDPFEQILNGLTAQERAQTWVHVDGAFGLWANAAPNRKHHVAGVEGADSWATDAHKWLNAPYDSAVVVVADGRDLTAAMAQNAAYASGATDDRVLMNMGLQMSQRARAIPAWAILASEGRAGVADAIERCCVAAERFAQHLAEAGATILAPVVINQVLVSFGTDEKTDAVTDAVQADGRAWMGGTTWHGQRAMRISVSDTSTTAHDVDVAVAAIVDAMHACC